MGDRLEGLAKSVDVCMGLSRVEGHPHEKVASFGVVELLGVENVEPAVEQRGRDFRNDPGPVDA